MGKNKKGKIMSMPSTPEGYFKSGMARKLPIYECLINKEWADQGLATIMISRKHINENLSWAIFLVDIYCLGVKDCFNRFNLPEVEYLEEKNIASDQFGMALIPCDYPLVHNIIYGAIEFAEDFGFFPHKDFKTTQYILEEDDDRVELIDIEFGKEGKPFYFVGPNEDPVKQSKILATLERTAGPGNFDFVAGEDAFGNEEEDLEYQEDDWDGIWEDETDMRKFFLESELIDIQDGKRDPEYIQTYVIIQHKYNLLKKDKPSSIGINMPRDLDIKNLFDDYLTEDEKYLPQNGKEQEILEKFIDPELPEPTEKEAEELEKAIDEHPHLFELYMLRIWLHDLFGFKLKDNFGENFFKKFPDEPYSKIIEAFKLCSKNDVEGALHIFKNKHLIQEAFPERNGEFTEMEILYFMALMCKCYTAKEDIASAKVFAQTIIKFGEETDLYTVVGLNDLMEYMIKAVGNAKSI